MLNADAVGLAARTSQPSLPELLNSVNIDAMSRIITGIQVNQHGPPL
jgi:hypothetical protein